MCDEEYLDIDEISDRPRNRLRLKEIEIELKNVNFRILSEKLDFIKQDLDDLEKSFERIYTDLCGILKLVIKMIMLKFVFSL